MSNPCAARYEADSATNELEKLRKENAELKKQLNFANSILRMLKEIKENKSNN